MSGDLLRFIGAVFASIVVAGLIMSVAGPRWHTLPPRVRRVSLALTVPFVVISYGFWYAAVHDLAVRPPTVTMTIALAFPAGAILYGVRSGK